MRIIDNTNIILWLLEGEGTESQFAFLYIVLYCIVSTNKCMAIETNTGLLLIKENENLQKRIK